jgi:hypothetical protein
MNTNMEYLVESGCWSKPMYWEGKLSQCLIVNHKSHEMSALGWNEDIRVEKHATNRGKYTGCLKKFKDFKAV